jgi:hypothetical protein
MTVDFDGSNLYEESLNKKKSTRISSRTTKKLKVVNNFMTAYNFFASKFEHQFIERFSKLSPNEIHKKLGEEWKKLKALKRTKEFDDLAAKDKIRYLQDCARLGVPPRFNAPPGYDISGNRLESSSNAQIRTASSSVPLIQKPERTLSAYSHFCRQEKDFVRHMMKGLNMNLQSTIGKIFKNRWTNMCPEERNLYVLLERSEKMPGPQHGAVAGIKRARQSELLQQPLRSICEDPDDHSSGRIPSATRFKASSGNVPYHYSGDFGTDNRVPAVVGGSLHNLEENFHNMSPVKSKMPFTLSPK